MEDFGLMTKGVYNRKKLLSVNLESMHIRGLGCSEKEYKENEDDFEKQMICMYGPEKYFVIASSFLSVKNDSNYISVMHLDSSNKYLVTTDVDDGLTYNLIEKERIYNPLILYKKNKQNGYIFVLNHNPFIYGGDKRSVLNIILLSLSRELLMTSKVNLNTNISNPDLIDNLPIPAGEFGFQLQIKIFIHNLNDKSMENSKLYLFLADNFAWVPNTLNCVEKKYIASEILSDIKQKKTINNNNTYYICDLKTILPYQKTDFKINIKVLNYEATQMKYNVLIMEPFFTYLDSNKKLNVLFNPIKANCEAAPVLSGAMNPDPSSFYPYLGIGAYIDNVLKIENKEESMAYNVEYYGLIPVLSPILDIGDQRKTQKSLKIYVDYYNSHNFEVPLTSDEAEDFIYPAELNGKGVYIVMNWDSPILPVKEISNSQGSGQPINIIGINHGPVTLNSTSEIIKQINYRKSERLYKLASQRLMAFVDTTTPEGAKAIYNGNIPSDLLDPVHKDRTKTEFLFSRLDIYFYDNENYVNPPGISEKQVITVDKYKTYSSKSDCVEKRGLAKSEIAEEGFFTNFDKNKKDIILQPNIYTNALFEYCDLTIIDPTVKGSLEKVFKNTENIKSIHYIIPNVDSNIIRPSQIINFTEKNEHYGYHQTYTSIQFLYLHSITYILNSKFCKYGGKIIIDIGSFKLPNKEDDITVSPDQIAVYKIEYINNKINIYFKRGLMSNEQFGKNVTLIINIENLNSEKDEPFDMTIEELTFDISNPPDFEIYTKIDSGKKEFKYISAFSFPAIQIKTQLNRTLNGYETLEPFSRYGVYTQEIYHRTVFGIIQSNHESDPAVQSPGLGFSFISNLGISSIPFIEYMTVGKGQVIPAGPGTSRISWKDIWGRTWQQPLRSSFPDVPPLPPPLKNFMMTTTFEILKNNKQIYEWPSDEDVLIHLHIKLLNNYPKYFEITRCRENQIRYIPLTLKEDHYREFANFSQENLTESELNGNYMFLRQGGLASYGACYADPKAYVEGEKVEGELLNKIKKAKLCADFTDAKKIAECEKELEDIKILHRAPKDWEEEKNGTWNYSPLVENYYPKGYINSDMWEFDLIDYDDTAMDKAYRYHFDNLLPNYDNTIDKPHNSISIPIYKGLGYKIVYNKNNYMNYHGVTKKGWWSDNLQNRDDTLLAGQAESNEISVDKKSTLEWIDAKALKGSKREGSEKIAQEIIDQRQKNIYTCLFNRRRPKYIPGKDKAFIIRNVDENNVVPIIVDLDKNDERLYKFNCNQNYYSPENISLLEDNYLETPTAKDYLYFAANLRAQAKESFNILLNLKKFDKVKYEGNVKVNEGGRFIYWNPVNGPNSFLIVDDPVNIIRAKRNDIEVINNIFPSRVDTFNSVIYHSYTIRDESNINREWPYTNYYSNSYGFGDVAVTVSVGGIKKSRPVLEPEQDQTITYAKIIFYNNCGFDWNMKYGAIDFEYLGEKVLNAKDLLNNIVHTIRVPLKYNFLTYTVEEEYKNYINIIPSGHNNETAPEFFDYENINVVTIRDGFKGEYNLKINISKSFPNELRGKPIEIRIGLNKTYFDKFPGEDSGTDPIKNYHKYNVTIPSIYIAVPFKEGEFKNKVFYTSAQATNLSLQFDINVDWAIDGIKYIPKELLEEMFKTIEAKNKKKKLNALWNKLKNEPNITYSLQNINQNKKRIIIEGIKEKYKFFPKKNLGAPDTAEDIIIIRSSVSQLNLGTTQPITALKMYYNDWINKYKNNIGITPSITATGPWITLTYTRRLVEYFGKGQYIDKPDQQLSPDDSGTMKVQFKITNSGNGPSLDTKYEIVIEPNLVFVDHNTGANKFEMRTNELGQTILTFDYGTPIIAGGLKGGIIYLNYSKICDSYDILTPEEKKALPKELPVAKESSVYMNIEKEKEVEEGEEEEIEIESVVEHLRQPLVFAYSVKHKTSVNIDLVISGKRSNPTVKIKPKINFFGNDKENNVEVYIGKIDLTKYGTQIRKLDEDDDNLKYANVYKRGKFVKQAEDKPIQFQKENKNHVVQYIVVVYGKDGSTCYNIIKYEQKKIHISTAEVVLIILSIIFFAASAFFIWRGYSNWKQIGSEKIERNLKDVRVQKLLDE